MVPEPLALKQPIGIDKPVDALGPEPEPYTHERMQSRRESGGIVDSWILQHCRHRRPVRQSRQRRPTGLVL